MLLTILTFASARSNNACWPNTTLGKIGNRYNRYIPQGAQRPNPANILFSLCSTLSLSHPSYAVDEIDAPRAVYPYWLISHDFGAHLKDVTGLLLPRILWQDRTRADQSAAYIQQGFR